MKLKSKNGYKHMGILAIYVKSLSKFTVYQQYWKEKKGAKISDDSC